MLLNEKIYILYLILICKEIYVKFKLLNRILVFKNFLLIKILFKDKVVIQIMIIFIFSDAKKV